MNELFSEVHEHSSTFFEKNESIRYETSRRFDGDRQYFDVSYHVPKRPDSPSPDQDPSVDYPKNVRAGRVGRTTLYALGAELTVRELFQRPFSEILNHAIARLGNQEDSKNEIRYPGPPNDRRRSQAVAALQRLNAALADIATLESQTQKGSQNTTEITLEFLCITPPEEWTSDIVYALQLYERAKDALLFVALPFMRVDHKWATKFLAPGRHDGKSFLDHLGDTRVLDLFARPRDAFDTAIQKLVPEARRNGLLWCFPAGYWVKRHEEIARHIQRQLVLELGKPASVRTAIEYHIEKPNGRDGTAFATLDPDLYCQRVNGTPNLMSDCDETPAND